jgi:hypothetical protein
MSLAYLVELVGFYYVSLVSDICLGVIGDHGKRDEKGPRGYKMGELQAPDLAI